MRITIALESNVQDAELLLDRGPGLSLQTVEKPLHALALRDLSGKRSGGHDAAQIFPSGLGISRAHAALRGLGRRAPPLPTPPRLGSRGICRITHTIPAIIVTPSKLITRV